MGCLFRQVINLQRAKLAHGDVTWAVRIQPAALHAYKAAHGAGSLTSSLRDLFPKKFTRESPAIYAIFSGFWLRNNHKRGEVDLTEVFCFPMKLLTLCIC